jgi:thiamine-monophosphate kinase
VELGRLPVEATVHAVAQALGRDPLPWLTGGGEDYELLLTCAPAAYERLAAGLMAATGTRLSAVGEMTAAATGIVYLDADGRPVTVRAGFEHFVTGRAGA